MALKNASLFLYNYQISATNQFISFATGAGEVPPNTRTATIPIGFYSLTSLCTAIASALTTADPLHTYTVTANRNVGGGLQNRITIATTNSYFGIYFATGNPSNPATLLGFTGADLTGATSYTGTLTSGTVLIPERVAYSYLPPSAMNKNFGKLNVSASGLKEAIVFSIQQFIQAQFKHIPEANLSNWLLLIQWMIQQRAFEFTPDITVPNTFYQVTLEEPNQGLELNLTEMLGDFPFYYQTPLMKFRLVNS